VLKTLYGVTQNEAPIRRAAHLIHCSLIEKNKRVNIQEFWPLPFDEVDEDNHESVLARLIRRMKEEKLKNSG
jgi:hypothetical protein